MKKILAVLLVLVLLVPTIGLACDCCANGPAPLQQTGLLKTSHHCCDTFDVNRDTCTIQKQDQGLPTFSQTDYLETISNVSLLFNQTVGEFSLALDTGPSSFSSKTPLYLANRVLRF